MSLIDETYFDKRILSIPNTNRDEVVNNISNYIEKFEPEYLNKVLGYELNKEFIAGLEEETPLQKWLDLRDGAEYADCNGRLQKWTGFVNAIKDSPIAFYVFWKFKECTDRNEGRYGNRNQQTAISIKRSECVCYSQTACNCNSASRRIVYT